MRCGMKKYLAVTIVPFLALVLFAFKHSDEVVQPDVSTEMDGMINLSIQGFLAEDTEDHTVSELDRISIGGGACCGWEAGMYVYAQNLASDQWCRYQVTVNGQALIGGGGAELYPGNTSDNVSLGTIDVGDEIEVFLTIDHFIGGTANGNARCTAVVD